MEYGGVPSGTTENVAGVPTNTVWSEGPGLQNTSHRVVNSVPSGEMRSRLNWLPSMGRTPLAGTAGSLIVTVAPELSPPPTSVWICSIYTSWLAVRWIGNEPLDGGFPRPPFG